MPCLTMLIFGNGLLLSLRFPVAMGDRLQVLLSHSSSSGIVRFGFISSLFSGGLTVLPIAG